MRLNSTDNGSDVDEIDNLEKQIKISKNGMAFDIFPETVFRQLMSHDLTSDDKNKLLEGIITTIENTKMITTKFKEVKPFLEFILAWIDKMDENLSTKLIQILRQAIESKLVSDKSLLKYIYTSTIKNLGSNIIDVRQESMRLFIAIMKIMNNKQFLSICISNLESTNWRIREEILNLIIINILNKIDPDFDYKSLIIALSKLINDENQKVRFVTHETLALLASKGDQQKVMDLWGQFIVHNEYLKFADKVDNNRAVIFNENSLMFEYPNKTIVDKKPKVKIRDMNGIKNVIKANIKHQIIQHEDSLDYATKVSSNNQVTMTSFDKSDYTDKYSTFSKPK